MRSYTVFLNGMKEWQVSTGNGYSPYNAVLHNSPVVLYLSSYTHTFRTGVKIAHTRKGDTNTTAFKYGEDNKGQEPCINADKFFPLTSTTASSIWLFLILAKVDLHELIFECRFSMCVLV